MNIDIYLKKMLDIGGSDLILKVGSNINVRVNGELKEITEDIILPDKMKELVEPLLNEGRRSDLKEFMGSDFSYSIAGVGRFRMNLSYQRNSYMLVARTIPHEVPTLEKLNLPKVLGDIINEKNGLILVTGATGSGKSTTVAAMLGEINKTQRKNIITLEDPIEFLYRDEKSMVSQKELGTDIISFEKALKFALRQDPDIIFIGELRDKETVEAALKAAETGHLVISTLHTINASQSISRILDLFPEERHKQLRYQLSETIRSIVSQRLLPTVDETRVAVNEILRNTPNIKECILTSEGIKDISKYLKEGRGTYGTQTFDQAILDEYNSGKITLEVALKYATVKKDIELASMGIGSTTTEF